MATTLTKFAGSRAGNYSTLPTVDVEILTDPALCKTCDVAIAFDPKAGTFGQWSHVEPVPAEHFIAARTRCVYCGTQDPAEVTYVQAPWSDEVRCTRCGGTNGFAIGD